MYDEFSVSFENPPVDPLGNTHVVGKLYCGRDQLELQFKLKDRAFRRGETEVVVFDYAEVESIEFRSRWFRPKILVFQTRSPEKLDDFPGAQVGRVVLHVGSASLEEARKVSAHIRFKQSEAFLSESEARIRRIQNELE